MSEFILRFGAIFLTFTIGLASNSLINDAVERWIESPEPVLEELGAPVQPMLPATIPLVRNCRLLVVKIGNDRSITLNGEEMGSLDNTSRLVATFKRVFTWRVEARAYRAGLELSSDVPEEERVEKTVLIKAPRWLSYGEVSDLIDVIIATGAEPIGVVTEGSGYPLVSIEQNR